MRSSFAIGAMLLVSACTLPADASERSGPSGAPASSIQQAVAPAVVDSVLPPAEEMRRFRAGGGPRRASLHGGAGSPEALVRAYLLALTARDTTAIRALVMDRLEYADLYYPGSRYARPPYRSPVGLVWSLLQLNSEKGAVRALRRLGGTPLRLVHLHCPAPPEQLGRSRVHGRCSTRYVVAPGDTIEGRLFSAIIETGGRYKFVSYASDM